MALTAKHAPTETTGHGFAFCCLGCLRPGGRRRGVTREWFATGVGSEYTRARGGRAGARCRLHLAAALMRPQNR